MVATLVAALLVATLASWYPATVGIVVGGLSGAALIFRLRDRFNDVKVVPNHVARRLVVLSPVLLGPGLALMFVGSRASGVAFGVIQFLGGVWLAFWLAGLGVGLIFQERSLKRVDI